MLVFEYSKDKAPHWCTVLVIIHCLCTPLFNCYLFTYCLKGDCTKSVKPVKSDANCHANIIIVHDDRTTAYWWTPQAVAVSHKSHGVIIRAPATPAGFTALSPPCTSHAHSSIGCRSFLIPDSFGQLSLWKRRCPGKKAHPCLINCGAVLSSAGPFGGNSTFPNGRTTAVEFWQRLAWSPHSRISTLVVCIITQLVKWQFHPAPCHKTLLISRVAMNESLGVSCSQYTLAQGLLNKLRCRLCNLLQWFCFAFCNLEI